MNIELKEQIKKIIDSDEFIEPKNAWLIVIVLLLLFPRKDNKGDELNV